MFVCLFVFVLLLCIIEITDNVRGSREVIRVTLILLRGVELSQLNDKGRQVTGFLSCSLWRERERGREREERERESARARARVCVRVCACVRVCVCVCVCVCECAAVSVCMRLEQSLLTRFCAL